MLPRATTNSGVCAVAPLPTYGGGAGGGGWRQEDRAVIGAFANRCRLELPARCGWQSLPENGSTILREHTINADDRAVFGKRLSQNHPIKRIFMVQWKRI